MADKDIFVNAAPECCAADYSKSYRSLSMVQRFVFDTSHYVYGNKYGELFGIVTMTLLAVSVLYFASYALLEAPPNAAADFHGAVDVVRTRPLENSVVDNKAMGRTRERSELVKLMTDFLDNAETDTLSYEQMRRMGMISHYFLEELKRIEVPVDALTEEPSKKYPPRGNQTPWSGASANTDIWIAAAMLTGCIGALLGLNHAIKNYDMSSFYKFWKYIKIVDTIPAFFMITRHFFISALLRFKSILVNYDHRHGQVLCNCQSCRQKFKGTRISKQLSDDEEFTIILCSLILSLLATYYSHFGSGEGSFLTGNVLAWVSAAKSIGFFKFDSFKTVGVLMIGFFLYDIYFVFATDVMETVACELARYIPASIFRLPSLPHYFQELNIDKTATDFIIPEISSYHLLGLGDVVIPGFFISLCLRYDLYRHHKTTKTAYHYMNTFKQTYFNSAIVSYIVGCTLADIALRYSNRAQPALLYLVPLILIGHTLTALIQGDFANVWAFNGGKYSD